MEIVRFDVQGPHGDGVPEVEPHPREILDGDTPRQFRHLYIHEQAYGLKAGVWGCTAFATKLVRQRSHEIVVVADGELEIADREDKVHRFGTNECFVLPAGIERRWIHRKKTSVFFVSLENQILAPDIVEPIRIDPGADLSPSKPPAAEMLLGPSPKTRICVGYEDPSKTWSAGVWDATPYHRKIIPFPRYEFMHLVEGEVSFTGKDGKSRTFKAGDTLLVPPGVRADWKNPVYLRKVFCVFKPIDLDVSR
jgi:uncharacterized cupin superfamily protein